MPNPEIINELENIRKQEQKIDRKKCCTWDTRSHIDFPRLELYKDLEMPLGTP